MSTAYEPNIQGAIAVLRDLMIANSFTMTREPYEPIIEVWLMLSLI